MASSLNHIEERSAISYSSRNRYLFRIPVLTARRVVARGSSVVMSHPERLRTNVHTSGVQGAKHPAGVRGSPTPGVPEILLFLLLRAACGGARGEKERCGDTPLGVNLRKLHMNN